MSLILGSPTLKVPAALRKNGVEIWHYGCLSFQEHRQDGLLRTLAPSLREHWRWHDDPRTHNEAPRGKRRELARLRLPSAIRAPASRAIVPASR